MKEELKYLNIVTLYINIVASLIVMLIDLYGGILLFLLAISFYLSVKYLIRAYRGKM